MKDTPQKKTPTSFAPKVREMEPEDAERLRFMFGSLSEETIYNRFHTPYPEVPGWIVAHLANADRPDARSSVAVAGGRVVGHAMYVRGGLDAAEGEAETAVVVEDGWQSRGVGKGLLFHLAREARREGVQAFTASVLGENRRMLGLLEAVFRGGERALRDGVYEVRVPLSGLRPVSKREALDLRPDDTLSGGGHAERLAERLAS